jgi:pyruvate dehydrogenase E1 component alpha subunit
MLYFMQLTRVEFQRTGRKIVGGVYVGRGQEAWQSAVADLRQADVVCPSHRDMGAFLIRGCPRGRFAQYMAGKPGLHAAATAACMGDMSTT